MKGVFNQEMGDVGEILSAGIFLTRTSLSTMTTIANPSLDAILYRKQIGLFFDHTERTVDRWVELKKLEVHMDPNGQIYCVLSELLAKYPRPIPKALMDFLNSRA